MLKKLQAADCRIFESVFNKQVHNSLLKSARIISFTGDGWLYPLLIPVLILSKPAQATQFIILALSGFALERLIYYCLKLSFKRRRPPNYFQGLESLIIASDEFSLPSGHTSAAFFFATFLVASLGPLFLILYLWAAAVGLSRIILGVHFPGDVLAGALIGSTLAILVL